MDDRAAMANRFEHLLLGLVFSLPFCSAMRFPPDPAFWGEWMGVTLFVVWSAVRLWPNARATAEMRAMPWSAVGFGALAALTVAQIALRSVRAVPESLLAVVVLVLAAAACITGTTARRNDRQPALLHAAALGLLAALGLNALFVVLGWFGIGVLGFEIIPVRMEVRAVGLIGQANQLGTLAVLAFFAAVYLRRTARLPAWVFGLSVIVAGLVCAASGSRTALVEWLAGMAVVAWRAGAPSVSPLRAAGLVWAVAGFGLLQIVWAIAIHGVDDQAVSIVRTSTAGRYELLRDGILLGLQHPWLGVGYGNFAGARLFELSGNLPALHADHAHNVFAQALAEWGLSGMIVVGMIAAVTLRGVAADSSRRASEHEGFVAVFVLCLFVHSLVEHPLWFPNFLLPFALMVGMLRQPLLAERRSVVKLAWPAAALIMVSGVCACALAAADYWRSQRIAVDISLARRHDPKTPVKIATADAMRIATGTMFPASADLMLARALEMNTDFAQFKLAVATRAVRAVPSAEMIARYVVFASLADHEQEAQAMLDGIKVRNRPVYDEVIKTLDQAVPGDSSAGAAASTPPAGPSSALTPP